MSTSLIASLRNGLTLSAAVTALTIACGGAQQPAAPAADPGPEVKEGSEAASPAVDAPAAAASAEPEGTSAAPEGGDADAGSSGSSPAATAAANGIIETKDECTPVGVDFEKRARPKLKECYREGKKKDPNLEGTVKIKMTIDVKGKIKSVKVVEKTLPDRVADCMLKVVKATPFPEVDKCWDATITIPITFPTPR